MIVVDASEVEVLTQEAIRSFERLPKEMARIVGRAASKARRSHAYKNRTGQLTASTRATPLAASPDGPEVELVAGVSYASFVNARNLMGLDEAAGVAAVDILAFLDAEGQHLAGL